MTLAADAWRLVFGPTPVSDGLAMREAFETRHFPATQPDRFAKLLGVADLDAFLRTDGAVTGRVSMANGAQQGSASVDPALYADEGGRIELPGLFEQFDKGATLVVSQFHDVHAPLADFCRGLERVFLHGVQSNIYLTPAGAQGFHAHYDTHDVLVLQVSGEKTWKIWDGQPVPHPTRQVPWDRKIQPEGEPRLLVMRPGDSLYVPRGVFHEAVAQQGTEPSLHITIGLLEPCWAEAFRLGFDALEHVEGGIREPFPTWRLTEPGAIERLARETAERLKAIDTDRLAQMMSLRLLDKLANERAILPSRTLLSKPPGPHDRLRLSDAVHHHVVPLDDERAELRWSGGVEKLNGQELGWLSQLDVGATPTELGGEEALAFCRDLVALGLLEPAPQAAIPRAAE
jgi:hypothetical protein